LLGQNVNSYGKGQNEDFPTFASLLQEVEKIDGIKRIRFMTSHPKDLSDELIEVLRKSKKICTHLHLPLQSGSTKVLKAMNRKYTKDQYLELVRKIRRAVPDISLTTDIIVGFPGETDQDFDDTISVIKEVRFDGAYTFLYSKRTGTPAAQLAEQISEEVKKERFAGLLTVIQQVTRKAMEKRIGMTATVLIEEVNAQDPQLVSGRLSGNTIVHCKGDKSMIGQFKEVRLTENKGFYYKGDLL
ncbi:MAG: MiaB/RimO family radical SAM methylthiotransferase, partial [Lachnoclostridium sp.]|nr:MiaB/RimO family radical SAM methylthiotransferase [Lachnoclostridium sp.]